MEENKKPTVALTNAERFPLIPSLSFLDQLKQHPHAPRYNFASGDRLHTHQLDKVHQYAGKLRDTKTFWQEAQTPAWLPDFLAWCCQTVPFYQNRISSLGEQPTIRRTDIRPEPWKFVSSECNLDDLLVYQTSGTTGAPMDVLFDPVSQACWLPQLQSILDSYAIRLSDDAHSVAIALICAQKDTLTYASLSTYLGGAGILKLNLNPTDWNQAADRVKYLEMYNPQILTGDPFAFLALMELQPAIRPKAMVSSAMKLTESVKNRLQSYFGCPVLDIYSLTECRMVAVAEGNRHRAIRPDLYLEVFDQDKDTVLPYGERGELVITGGNNPFLPLIRYRTGDFCRLQLENGIPYLLDLEARAPVMLYTYGGKLLNTIDISREMTTYPLAGFQLHQRADKSVSFVGWSNEEVASTIQTSLQELFGEGCAIAVIIHRIGSDNTGKSVVYTSDFVADL